MLINGHWGYAYESVHSDKAWKGVQYDKASMTIHWVNAI